MSALIRPSSSQALGKPWGASNVISRQWGPKSLLLLSFLLLLVYTSFTARIKTSNQQAAPHEEPIQPPVEQPQQTYLEDCVGNSYSMDNNHHFKALVGILTVPAKAGKRTLIRNTYFKQAPPNIKFKFFLCENIPEDLKDMIEWEQELYGDIDLIPCEENMDEGKTYAYLLHLYKNYDNQGFNFVFKCDDDTFVNPINLANDVLITRHTNSYIGRGFGKYGKNPVFFGMLYGISWDVLDWLAHIPDLDQHSIGTEDHLLPQWFTLYNKSVVSISKDHTYFDHKWSKGGWTEEYRDDAVAIHLVKDDLFLMDSYRHYFGCLDQKQN